MLSRARQGMIIFGNADQMEAAAKSRSDGTHGLWASAIGTLRAHNRVCNGLPIYCQKHVDYKNIIRSPADFARLACNGGCLKDCGARLPCGHACTLKCHPDDPTHEIARSFCQQPCTKSCPDCMAPCPRLCSEPCGACMEVIDGPFELPQCGHAVPRVKCFQRGDLARHVLCQEVVPTTCLASVCGCPTLLVKCATLVDAPGKQLARHPMRRDSALWARLSFLFLLCIPQLPQAQRRVARRRHRAPHSNFSQLCEASRVPEAMRQPADVRARV